MMARILRAFEVPALVMVPVVLAACAFFQVEQSALLTLVVALAAVAVFFASFEASRPALRQIMPAVVLGALGAAGRIEGLPELHGAARGGNAAKVANSPQRSNGAP